MTIGGWIFFFILAFLVGGTVLFVLVEAERKCTVIISIVAGVAIITASFFGIRWYFQNTASGQRALIDQKSNLEGGIDRIVTVYTANGEIIAQYQGKIDIDANDGGYIKFDFEGNRYIYYNCFVETIAKIEDE